MRQGGNVRQPAGNVIGGQILWEPDAVGPERTGPVLRFQSASTNNNAADYQAGKYYHQRQAHAAASAEPLPTGVVCSALACSSSQSCRPSANTACTSKCLS